MLLLTLATAFRVNNTKVMKLKELKPKLPTPPYKWEDDDEDDKNDEYDGDDAFDDDDDDDNAFTWTSLPRLTLEKFFLTKILSRVQAH